MSKRKLNRRQNWRIQKVQAEKVARLNRKIDEIDADETLGPEEEGLVVSHFGTLVEVETQNRERVPCHFRANLGAIVTGDQAVIRRGDTGRGVIETLLPRRTLLSRPDTRGQLKPVAANMDFIILVISPEPTPSSLMIDRYLVAAELQQLPIKILLNKTDLLNASNRSEIERMLARYQAIGYDIWQCSCKNESENGLAALKEQLDNRISVFVGQSGVGKSSLVNALLPGENTRVGELSESSKLGRHTTTNARLFHFPSGGHLIDSPGIREFGLWHLEPEQLIDGFCDFDPWRFQCKFRDCRHQGEPGCALRKAVDDGDVQKHRLDNYFAILHALENPER